MVDIETIREKLTKLTDNFSFIATSSTELELFVDSAIALAREKYEESDQEFSKYALKSLKKQIKEKINYEYTKDRNSLFARVINYISNDSFDDVKKLKLLTAVLNSIKDEIDSEFYKELISKYQELGTIISNFLVTNKKREITVDYELLAMYSSLRPFLDEYIKTNNIRVTEEKKEDKNAILTHEEVKAIYRRIHSGDNQAKEELILKNIRLVKRVASWYANRGVDYEDLVQEGLLGLNLAIERYNPNLGYTFSTYSTWWIKQKIQRYVDDNISTIRIPVHKRAWLTNVRRKLTNLETKLGRKPTLEEIQENLGLSEKDLQEYHRLSYPCTSLNKKVEGGKMRTEEDTEFGDFIADDANHYEELLDKLSGEGLLKEIRGLLTDKEFTIVCMRNGVIGGREHTLEEVGQVFNVTRERIRQVEAKAYRKLRSSGRLHQYNGNLEEKIRINEICEGDDEAIAYIKYRTGLGDTTPMEHTEVAKKMNISLAQLSLIRQRAANYLRASEDSYSSSLLGVVIGAKPKEKPRTEKIRSLKAILKEKYSEEEIPQIIGLITEDELQILKQKYGENLDEVTPVEDKEIIRKINYLVYNQIHKRYEASKKKKQTQPPKPTKKVEETLKEMYPDVDINTILSLLSEEEKNGLRLAENNGKTAVITKMVEALLPKINALFSGNLPQEKTERKEVSEVKKAKSFKEVLEEKYSEEERELIMSSLSAEEIKALQSRYGENLDAVITVEDKKLLARINAILYAKIPKKLNENKEDAPSTKRKAKTFKAMLEEKYSEEERALIMSSLTEEEKIALRQRFGENLDDLIETDDKGLLRKISYIVYNKIPKNLTVKRNAPGDAAIEIKVDSDKKKRAKTFKEYLKTKYSEEQIAIIMSSLTEEELALLQKKYGEALDSESKENLSSQEKNRIRNLVYVSLPKRITLVKEEKKEQAVIPTKKEELPQQDLAVEALPQEECEIHVEEDDKQHQEEDSSFISKIKPSLIQIRDALSCVISLISEEETKREMPIIKKKTTNNNS